MSTPPPARKRLPARPSEENLKKQAKRRAKATHLRLAKAQHLLAREYGFASWRELMRHIASIRKDSAAEQRQGGDAPPPAPESGEPAPAADILAAAASGQLEAVKLCLDRGADVNARDDKGNAPLSLACRSPARAEDRLAIAKLLIAAGAAVRQVGEAGTMALHWAARHGPAAMAELLIRHDAKEWLGDNQGKLPIDYARDGAAPDRQQIIELLDRPAILDPAFKAAVVAIQTGDLPTLRRLLTRHPNLVHDRAVEPDCYPRDYFRDPRLLWFVADNPNLIDSMPANTLEIAEAIINAGAEPADLDYTLGLVTTSQPAREQRLQRPLIRLLMARGATVTSEAILMTLGHCERDAVAALLEAGVPVTATIAAGMGRVDELDRLLASASDDEKHAALSMAVINREIEAARRCLQAGADVNRFAAVHRHSLPIHQAAVNDDVPMLRLLVEHGARLDIRDTLWNATPLGWAVHTRKPAAEAYLRLAGSGRAD